MLIDIGFRGQDGKLHELEDYDLEESEMKRLKQDFQNYVSLKNPPHTKGGVYECTLGGKPKQLFLKFDEIVYIG